MNHFLTIIPYLSFSFYSSFLYILHIFNLYLAISYISIFSSISLFHTLLSSITLPFPSQTPFETLKIPLSLLHSHILTYSHTQSLVSIPSFLPSFLTNMNNHALPHQTNNHWINLSFIYKPLLSLFKSHAPCTMHHTPCTMHHAPCTMHHTHVLLHHQNITFLYLTIILYLFFSHFFKFLLSHSRGLTVRTSMHPSLSLPSIPVKLEG